MHKSIRYSVAVLALMTAASLAATPSHAVEQVVAGQEQTLTIENPVKGTITSGSAAVEDVQMQENPHKPVVERPVTKVEEVRTPNAEQLEKEQKARAEQFAKEQKERAEKLAKEREQAAFENRRRSYEASIAQENKAHEARKKNLQDQLEHGGSYENQRAALEAQLEQAHTAVQTGAISGDAYQAKLEAINAKMRTLQEAEERRKASIENQKKLLEESHAARLKSLDERMKNDRENYYAGAGATPGGTESTGLSERREGGVYVGRYKRIPGTARDRQNASMQ